MFDEVAPAMPFFLPASTYLQAEQMYSTTSSARRRTEENSRRLQERLWQVSRLATVGEMAWG